MRNLLSCRRGRSSTHRAAGFSVLETLIVLGVIGLVVGIGLPSLFQQLSRNRLEAAANNVANLMRQTRLRAIRDNSTLTVQMASGDTTVEGMGVIGPVTLEFLDTSVAVYTDVSPDCTEFGTAGVAGHYDAFVTYQSTGTTDGPGAICVADGNGNILQVAVDSTTAQPRIRKYLPTAYSPSGAGFYQNATGSTADPDTWGSQVWVWF